MARRSADPDVEIGHALPRRREGLAAPDADAMDDRACGLPTAGSLGMSLLSSENGRLPLFRTRSRWGVSTKSLRNALPSFIHEVIAPGLPAETAVIVMAVRKTSIWSRLTPARTMERNEA
jgi:hypothetical protein